MSKSKGTLIAVVGGTALTSAVIISLIKKKGLPNFCKVDDRTPEERVITDKYGIDLEEFRQAVEDEITVLGDTKSEDETLEEDIVLDLK